MYDGAGLQFVAVGDAGTVVTAPSSDPSMWTLRPTGLSPNLKAVAGDGTRFVAVGQGGAILTSPTGTTVGLWTQPSSGTTNDLNGITWDGLQFVAVGQGGVTLTSLDGTTWSVKTSGTRNLYAVDSDGGTPGNDLITATYDITVPAGGRAAIVTFVLMSGTDSGETGGINAKAAEIDAEAKNIVTKFKTDAQYTAGMTQQQIDAVKNF